MSIPTNTGSFHTTPVMPCYNYHNGKLVIHNREEYRKLRKRNKLIKRALTEENKDNG